MDIVARFFLIHILGFLRNSYRCQPLKVVKVYLSAILLIKGQFVSALETRDTWDGIAIPQKKVPKSNREIQRKMQNNLSSYRG